jgi:thioredoxin reductase (NADPH)
MEQLVILGSGPAGLTAAIYAARASLNPLLVHGPQPGGQLTITSEVENWPGAADGIMGPQLMADMRRQAERFGTRFLEGWVTAVDVSVSPKRLTLSGGEVLEAKAVIIASGATALWTGAPGEEELKGRGVSACATCDGFFFRGKRVVVVGGGDSALEEATFLTRFAEQVTIVHRRDTLKASKAMQARAKENAKIAFRWNEEIVEVLGQATGHVTGVRVRHTQTGAQEDVACDGLFVAIGHKPNTGIFSGQLTLDEKGYIVPQSGTTRTSVDGVFVAGDVADHVYRQAVTAAGTGCMAALDAERWLEGR